MNFTASHMSMEAQKEALLKIVLMLFLIQFGLSQQVPLKSSAERSALLNLRSSLGLRGKDWPIKAEPCFLWVGVQCEDGRATGVTVSGLKRTRAGRLNPTFAVDSLLNLTSLFLFNASGFPLPGFIPDWLGEFLITLQVLDLRSASIIGPIPSSLGNLGMLNSLYLSGNSLTGTIPSALGQLSQLRILDLSQNSLTGSIPPVFSLLSNLTRLELASNFLSGPIPSSLGSLSRLQVLNLSDNSFTSDIPAQLGSLHQLLELDLSKNSLSGSFPLDLRRLGSLNLMDIGDNYLEGPLPGSLFASFAHLRKLVLRGNILTGELPLELLTMPSLQLFDVSNNNFTGLLHKLRSNVTSYNAVFNLSNNLLYGSLNTSLQSYGSIDVRGNYFQGKVPDDSRSNATLSFNCLQNVQEQRSLEECRIFYSHKGMAFDDSGLLKLSKKNIHLKVILIGLFTGLGFIVILVFLLVMLLRFCQKSIESGRGNTNVGPVPKDDGPSLPKDFVFLSGLKDSFTYQQILQCTDNFSETNLMKHGHSGDLFLGCLEGGQPVVVKKFNFDYLKKESYMRELEFFSKASHMRLVPLIGHCFGHEIDKVLVYKYMPYGDLARCLHKVSDSVDDNVQTLDWITRLKVAISAAEVLSYLHHECNPPLVHRDVQASSILLDDKFEVRLGSLSEVCAQEGDTHQHVLSRLRRKSQTSEPGPSGSSMATCAHDVHCFGKVLLELVTGKLGISKSESASTKEWLERTMQNISIYDKELITKIIDPSLIVDEDLLEEVWAMAVVAKTCLNPKPSRRPPMRYVLKALENPLKVVRDDSSSSGRLRTTSSRRFWSGAFFGSRRDSSSEGAAGPNTSGSKQAGRIGSHGSGGNDLSSSNKRLSSEIFPEPVETHDIERQE